MISFDVAWSRIQHNAGEKFRQIRGGEFSYAIKNGAVIPDRTNRQIPRSNFLTAFDLLPFENTSRLQSLQGPSYIYAILMDKRIRGNDW